MTETAVIECVALGWVVLFTVLAPRWARVIYVRGMRLLGRLASRPLLTTAVLGLGTAGVAAALAYVVHWPEPSVHDEFAYLLGAETFAGGELTRPTPPAWENFETFHVLVEPSYAPKYPPGQSLVLALGMVLTGEIRAGLWLSVGAMVAALFWMLTQWVPRRWALLGATLVAMHLGIRGPWVQTFFGGAVAATGGALMLGAVPGILRRRSTASALLLASGLVLLGLTRPFEGLVASLPAAVALLVAWVRAPKGEGLQFAVRVALPIVVVLAGLVGFMGLHNQAVTGSPTTLPYAAYDAEYSVYPPFLFQEPAPVPDYRHPVLEDFMLHFQRGAHSADGAWGLLKQLWKRHYHLVAGLLGSLAAVLLIVLGAVALWPGARWCAPRLRTQPVTVPVLTLLLLAGAACLTTYAAPHYAAPGLGALLVVSIAIGRRVLNAPRSVRRRCAAALVASALAVAGVTAERASKRWLGGERYLGKVRGQINAGLIDKPGADLVLVLREPATSVHHEFVYNAADMDQAEVVWARDLGEERNREVLSAFPGRNVWRLTMGSLRDNRWTLERVGPDLGSDATTPSAPRWGTW